MILVTVGTEVAFDRMVRVVDTWAREAGRPDVFAQIGEGAWKPEFIDWADFLEPPEFRKRFQEASVIIGHAGMGTILSALHYGKPLLVMPRRASLGEQRNEHQLATAKNLLALGKINVAMDEGELRQRLETIEELDPRERIGPYADPKLVTAIREFIAA